MQSTRNQRLLFVNLLFVCLLANPLLNLYAQRTVLDTLSIGNVPLSYTFRSIESKCIKKATAWKWRSTNQDSKNWRPQGIAGVSVDTNGMATNDSLLSSFSTVTEENPVQADCTPYLLVSWYDSKDEKKGAKISFVNLQSNTYRSILLVDQNFKDYGSMHAGGIAVIRGKLHVADSRSNTIRVFDLNKILHLEKKINTYYSYVMVEEFNYSVPLKPSTLSYDVSQDKIVIGKYKKSSSSGVPFCWLSPPKTTTEAQNWKSDPDAKIYRIPNKYKKLQGIASELISDSSGYKKIALYVTQSFGDYDGMGLIKPNGYKQSTVSKLLITIDNTTTFDSTNSYGTPIEPDSTASLKFKEKCGDGVESLFLTNFGLWTLTEFAKTRKVLLFKDPDSTWSFQ